MDKFQLLRNYKALMDEGVISEEEFEAKKKAVLAMPEDVVEIKPEITDKPPVSPEVAGKVSGNEKKKKRESSVRNIFAHGKKKKAAENAAVADKADEAEKKVVFCDRKENQERILTEEEKMDQFRRALELVNDNTPESYREAIALLAPLGTWRKSDLAVEKIRRALEMLEQQQVSGGKNRNGKSSDSAEEKNSIFRKRKMKSEKCGSAEETEKSAAEKETTQHVGEASENENATVDKTDSENEKREEMKTAAEQSEAECKEVPEELKEEKEKSNTLKKVILWIVAAAVVVAVGVAAYGMSMPDLADMSETETEYIVHNMTYSLSDDWKPEKNLSEENVKYYKYSQDGAHAVLEVGYYGESDLYGDAGDSQEYLEVPEGVTEILGAGCLNEYKLIVEGSSVFCVTVYYDTDKLKNTDEALERACDSFDLDSYENPRKFTGISVKYTGSTAAGVRIDSDNEGIEVTEKYSVNGVTGQKASGDWEIRNPVKLSAGRTSTVTVKVGEKSKKLNIKCTTLSRAQYMEKCRYRNYKNQLRKADYGTYIKIYGQVLQDCGAGYFRVSSNGGYDDIYYVYAPDSDIVEDDWVTVYGQTDGIETYETVMGNMQKIPKISAKYTYR